MILVSEAGWRGLSALDRFITAPDLVSTTIEAVEAVAFDGERPMGVAVAARIRIGGDSGEGQHGCEANMPQRSPRSARAPAHNIGSPNPVSMGDS